MKLFALIVKLFPTSGGIIQISHNTAASVRKNNFWAHSSWGADSMPGPQRPGIGTGIKHEFTLQPGRFRICFRPDSGTWHPALLARCHVR